MFAPRRTSVVVWKNSRVVNTGMPTNRSSPLDFAIISDDIDISATSNSANRNCRQNSSDGCRHGGNEVDAVGLDLPVDDRPGARIRGEADAELKSHESVPP